MSAVTVCVPAFEGAAWISETLRSVAAQTYRDLVVEVAVDPSPSGEADGTAAAVEPFLADPRFRLHANPVRLGWDGNVRAQLERVTTPYAVVLPQDDMFEPDYVESLVAALAGRPDVGVAYADLTYVDRPDRRRVLDLPFPAGRDEQLLAWCLAGGGAVPWHGVTRTESLRAAGGFPTDGFRGFLVECEYTLALLLTARAVRVARPLYLKRIHPPEVRSASRLRVETSPAEQRAAFARHRERMRSLLREARPPLPRATDIVQLAHEAQLLRYWVFSGGAQRVLDPADRRLAERLLGEVEAWRPRGPAAAGRVAAMLHEVLGWDALGLGREEEAGEHAHAASAADESYELLRHLLWRVAAAAPGAVG